MDYVPIKSIINEIDEKYGERKDLLLMDNNVLKTPKFDKIIDDIIELGYGKGATKINPKTGKPNRVYVDFNQGLDMNFLTEEKMKRLASLAVSPVRIAFDHIDDSKKYSEKMRLANKYGVKQMSNYMLYNTDDFKGKGVLKNADTPRDLYERLWVNVQLQEEFNVERRKVGEEICVVYSFPMKFVPLGNKTRTYTGKNWTVKQIRSLQRMINGAAGVVLSAKQSFENTFGKTYEEFEKNLWCPQLYLEKRGKHSNAIWNNSMHNWREIYETLTQKETLTFHEIIKNNIYSAEQFLTISSSKLRKLYLHYFHSTVFVKFLNELKILDILKFEMTRKLLLRECSEIVAVNIELLVNLKNKESYVSELAILLFSETENAA